MYIGFMLKWKNGFIAVACMCVLTATPVVSAQAPSLTETQKLLASDGAPGDLFGTAIDRERDTLIIGAPQHTTNALPGSFYVFERDGNGQWIEQARVFSDYQPGEAAFGDLFGHAVALRGDTLLVGAPFAELDGVMKVGLVYVFERDESGQWVQQQILLPDGDPPTQFGENVIVVRNTAVITGLFRAFVYTRDAAGVWSQQAELAPGFDSGTIRTAAFDGWRIALTRYVLPLENPHAVIFTAGDGGWSEPEPIEASLPPGFGFIATTGAWFCGNRFALGIGNLDGPDHVSLFSPDIEGGWSEEMVLTHPDPDGPFPDNDSFGGAIHGGRSAMTVGAEFGNRAFVFQRSAGGEWNYMAQLQPSDAFVQAQNFGSAVHLRDRIPIVGSRAHHENGLYAGAAYVFDLESINIRD